ncbi:MAG: hypothetical protein RQ748_08495, partial [Elusimicrobiales bacterium]|nr:hypothetical protein [Elusimicrobiales bacterium]
MRYWLYSEGNIIGPYTPADLLGLPAFGQGSLVCAEHSNGEAADDWKPAEQVAEISAAMSVGVGGVIDGGGIAGFYSMESGYPSGAGQYYDYKFQDGSSYSSALEAIDSVLGAYKEEPSSPALKPEDEDSALLDKFDVRLSKIQEELEAARWEKNLLLEKMRLKETEERKTRDRMAELEARLKDALDGRFPSSAAAEASAPAPAEAPPASPETAPAASAGDTMRHGVPVPSEPAPEKEEDHPRHEEILEETRKVEEFSNKELSSAAEAPARHETPPEEREEAPQQEAKPSKPLKSFKSLQPSQTLKRKNLLGDEDEEAETPVGKRSLKSLGYAKAKRILGDEAEEEAPASGPGRAAPQEPAEPSGAPIPGSAMVYDFTVVTPRHGDSARHGASEKVNFKIQPMDEPPPSGDTMQHGVPAAPVRAAAPAPAPVPAPAPEPVADRQPFKPAETFQKEPVLPSFTPPRAAAPPPAASAAQAPSPAPAPEAAPIVFSPGSPAAEVKPAPAAAK